MRGLIYLIIAMVLALTGCKSRNKLNTNEKELSAEVAKKEAEIAAQKAKEEAAIKRIPISNQLKQKENRTMETSEPPVVLDIMEARKRVKPFSYSMLANKIEYVLLRHPSDSAYFKRGVGITVTPNNIITQVMYREVARFNRDGSFVETICDNRTEGLTNSNSMRISRESFKKYKGTLGDVVTLGDKLFFSYGGFYDKRPELICYDASPGNKTLDLNENVENKKKRVKGDVICQIDKSHRRKLFMLDEKHFLAETSKMKSSETGHFMVMYSTNGDTVCALKDHDPIVNFTGSVMRNPDGGSKYRSNGRVYFRQSYNDTIFEVKSSNRFVPRYVVDYGEKGFNGANDGINPSVGLKDKFVPRTFIETNRFIFITYTQDYCCPATARSGSLKYNKFVYNKETGESFHVYIDAEPYVAKKTKDMPMAPWPSEPRNTIQNDLDAGLAFWPRKLADDGTIYFGISIKQLKEHVKSKQFDKAGANAELLMKIVEKGTERDYVVMLLK
ncbi:hypothetical protein EMN47_11525 [Prolixibacteraceae bacterium JC049]|nr:hypothetical protein [Prolixibacteraceae bacterium JC049]